MCTEGPISAAAPRDWNCLRALMQYRDAIAGARGERRESDASRSCTLARAGVDYPSRKRHVAQNHAIARISGSTHRGESVFLRTTQVR